MLHHFTMIYENLGNMSWNHVIFPHWQWLSMAVVLALSIQETRGPVTSKSMCWKPRVSTNLFRSAASLQFPMMFLGTTGKQLEIESWKILKNLEKLKCQIQAMTDVSDRLPVSENMTPLPMFGLFSWPSWVNMAIVFHSSRGPYMGYLNMVILMIHAPKCGLRMCFHGYTRLREAHGETNPEDRPDGRALALRWENPKKIAKSWGKSDDDDDDDDQSWYEPSNLVAFFCFSNSFWCRNLHI